jgi:hypothetical protein
MWELVVPVENLGPGDARDITVRVKMAKEVLFFDRYVILIFFLAGETLFPVLYLFFQVHFSGKWRIRNSRGSWPRRFFSFDHDQNVIFLVPANFRNTFHYFRSCYFFSCDVFVNSVQQKMEGGG